MVVNSLEDTKLRLGTISDTQYFSSDLLITLIILLSYFIGVWC